MSSIALTYYRSASHLRDQAEQTDSDLAEILHAMADAHDNTAEVIKSLEAKIATLEDQLAQANNQLEDLRNG